MSNALGRRATGNGGAALLGLAGFGLFATHDALIKALGGTYAPFQILFFSVLLSFPLTTLLLMRDPTEGNLLPHHPGWLLGRTMAVVLTGVCAFYAFSTLPLAQVYAIVFAAPLLITVLSIPVLGETVRLRRWLAVLVGLLGVLIVLRPGSVELSLGHAAALGAAAGSAFASVVVRKIGRDERPVVLLLYPMVANLVLMGAILPLVYEPMPLGDLVAMAGVAGLALGGTMLMIAAYRAGTPSVVAPMQYSQILWATLYGALFFGEVPDAVTALGAAVVIGSGLYILFREAHVSETQPVLRTRTRLEMGTTPRLSPLLRHQAAPPGAVSDVPALDRGQGLHGPAERGGSGAAALAKPAKAR